MLQFRIADGKNTCNCIDLSYIGALRYFLHFTMGIENIVILEC